ncbi:orotidine 5'-phosphate decarboxylase [Candidatus Gottesmanbacteria bacterium RIFCSPHIGHO2_02_FULL_40_13]|uniref:Orotidine 5'-phosphate decarboxylase n=1 Tax=Candidatus Gottesmanbacteria bacterium RIFCSPHIGHO2_02_FULL_40_13 TaxID=1798384 RepID=A0A1F6AA70_9BACT|nr:MAG: orotidine 5'-phosphate decarboxylase [Candidatus Gottesmanbacteria bacterium RIFCSPHIGHO2_02_FULL_40_13]
MTFQQKLDSIVKKNNTLVCVGLDSEITKIPEQIRNGEHPQSTFNKAIIDATHDLVCAYKPNTAFYEARGKAGIEALKMTCDYIKEKYPEIPVILDAKRADIGSTNEGYVKFAFDYLGADAITLHPYLGKESLKPFLDRKNKGLFILCRTSNPGSGEFQDLLVTGDKDTSGVARRDSPDGGGFSKSLYQIIAEHIVNDWNYNGNCGLVVGATYPDELKIVRRIVGDGFPLLIPGVGSQGGDVEKTARSGVDKDGLNAIINSSRGIIFASNEPDFSEKAREKLIKLKLEINKDRNIS